MEKSRTENVTHIESESGRELACVDEFKQVIHENPGLVASFLKFDDIAKNKFKEINLKPGYIFEEGNLKLTVVYFSGNEFFYYNAEVGGENFFIKSFPGYHESPGESKGVEEFKSIQEAKKALVGVEGVDVVDFQFGYEDKKGHTYFVSKWADGVLLLDYLRNLKSIGELKEKEELEKKIDNIRVRLQNFYDVRSNNMLFNPQTKKIIIFDIHLIF